MDKNEVITLSSDDETETAKNGSNAAVSSISGCKDSQKVYKNPGVIVRNNKEGRKTKASDDSPEVVDLEEFLDESDEVSSPESYEDSKLDIIDLDEASDKNDSSDEENKNQPSKKHNLNQENVSTDPNSNPRNSSNETCKSTKEDYNKNLQFFTEFVEHCGSLEKVPNDRARLTRKLMKRYGEADGSYIKSEEFRSLIEKCRDKVNKNNLYLIAKEVTEELSYKKRIAVDAGKSKEENQSEVIDIGNDEASSKFSKKRAKFINKIVKKLDKLGGKIRELEEQEVDLSDEEDSNYVLLQRYRDRFCQIYKRLCAYTNQIPDPHNRKICFTESKYPAINKCIENWLNKTKRFPDFSDIMKLLESQSSSLGLPSNREVVRTVAVEIFQKVGVMLQRKRIYDLWDIFCGFLDDGKDPADSDPVLDQTLKNHFETRLKKEQEIFQHYSELQEKEKLEPEEVEDEEANQSPVESGNEDEKEIEEIENSLNKKADDTLKYRRDTGDRESEGSENNSENETDTLSSVPDNSAASKETKNNYRNCKSLKWRQENSGKTKSDTSNSEDSSTSAENEKEKPDNGVAEPEEKLGSEETKEVEKSDSDLELITLEDVNAGDNDVKTGPNCGGACKAVSDMETESPSCKRKKYPIGDDLDIFDLDDENGKTKEVFGVHCCQIFPDSIFQDFDAEEKDWGKRKVFRDLTNVNRLMELHGKRKKMSGLFSPAFFHRSFHEYEKSSWKKRFKVSFQVVGAKDQKCALNHEEKSTKAINSDSGGDSDEKDVHNSEGGGDEEGDNFFKSHGNGSEEDNNEDENKKSRGTNDERNENQHEEEDDEEEEEGGETQQNLKTEVDYEQDNESPFGNKKNFVKNNEVKESVIEQTEPELSLQNGKNENEKMNETEQNQKVMPEGGDELIINERKDFTVEDSEHDRSIEEIMIEEVKTCKEEIKSNGQNYRAENIRTEDLENHETFALGKAEIEPSGVKKPLKRSTSSASDEERVKRFLMHSPSSISITPPKKLSKAAQPSPAALQALETLRNLKGISTTVVRSKPNPEDDVVVIENSPKKPSSPDSAPPAKRRRTKLPVISNVQSMAPSSALFNFAGFEEPSSGMCETDSEPSTIKILSVWGNVPGVYTSLPIVEFGSPGCSSSPETNAPRKKNSKKPVEYVVLE